MKYIKVISLFVKTSNVQVTQFFSKKTQKGKRIILFMNVGDFFFVKKEVLN